MIIVFNGQTFEKKLYSTIFFPFTYAGHLLVAKGQGKDNRWTPIGPSLHLVFSESCYFLLETLLGLGLSVHLILSLVSVCPATQFSTRLRDLADICLHYVCIQIESRTWHV